MLVVAKSRQKARAELEGKMKNHENLNLTVATHRLTARGGRWRVRIAK